MPKGEKLLKFLVGLMLWRFYGTVTIRFESGKVTHVETETYRVWDMLQKATIIGAVIVLLSGCVRPQTQRLGQPGKLRNQVTNPVSGDMLAESRGWIYLRKRGTASWKKLIPGRCPQWFSAGRQFYYFLDVGYDGCRAQLWSAGPDGEARLRVSLHDYFIRRSPVVSQDGRRLAWHYSTCGASNFLEDIKVLDLDGGGQEKVVLRCPRGTKIESLAWARKDLLRLIVDGQAKYVDTTGMGTRPIP